MTEESKFIQDNGEQNPNASTGFQDADLAPAGQEGVDTKDPSYQIQVMQQRMADKDSFINTLKEENQKTREMYASLEEKLQNLSNIEEVLNNKYGEQDVGNQDTTGLDEDALVGKVIEKFKTKEAQAKAESNYNSVLERMKTEVGAEHIEGKVAQAAQANGLTVDDMVNMAKQSPSAFYKLVGLEANTTQHRTPTPMRGTQQPPQETGEKDFAYYSRLLRENPREYWKPEVQREFRKLFTEK